MAAARPQFRQAGVIQGGRATRWFFGIGAESCSRAGKDIIQ